MAMKSDRMSRRRILGGAVGLAGLVAAGWPRRAHARRADATSPAGRLLEIFRDTAAAAAVGRAYLLNRPEEQDRDRLVALLMSRAAGGPDGAATAPGAAAVAAPDHRTLHERLRRCTREDFACGRTVWVQGVLLARTEARLYALAAVA